VEPCHLLTEPDAPGAVDATVHVGHHQRPHVLVLHCTLVFLVASRCVPVVVGVVLEVALSSLVADGAVQGMVGQ